MYFQEWQEPHPYGNTVAYERRIDCSATEPGDCGRITQEDIDEETESEEG